MRHLPEISTLRWLKNQGCGSGGFSTWSEKNSRSAVVLDVYIGSLNLAA